MAKITLFDGEQCNPDSAHVDLSSDTPDLDANGIKFNDKTHSISVESGTWMLFEDAAYRGEAISVNAHGGFNGDGKYLTGREFHHIWGVSSVKKVSDQG